MILFPERLARRHDCDEFIDVATCHLDAGRVLFVIAAFIGECMDDTVPTGAREDMRPIHRRRLFVGEDEHRVLIAQTVDCLVQPDTPTVDEVEVVAQGSFELCELMRMECPGVSM